MATASTITIEGDEVEGLAEYLELRMESVGDGLYGAENRRAYAEYLSDLVELGEHLNEAAGEAVTLTRSPMLEALIRDAGEDGAGRVFEGLAGDGYPEPEQAQEAVRLGKKTVSLALRHDLLYAKEAGA